MLPGCPDASIVNLSHMQKIKIIDKELGLFRIEPGVTQGLLQEFLQKSDLNFFIPTTGAGPTCSLIGNALDKGYGLTPIQVHYRALFNFEAVLPDGNVYKDFFNALGCEYISNFYNKNLGQDISALFAQSNLAIVTKATIQLIKRADNAQVFNIGIKNNQKLFEFIQILQKMHFQFGSLLPSLIIMNKYRVKAYMEIEKKDDAKSNIINKVGGFNQMEWMIVGTIQGPKELTKPAMKLLKQMISNKVDLMQTVSHKNLVLIKRFLESFAKFKILEAPKKALSQALETISFLRGYPNIIGLKLAYLRNVDKLTDTPNPTRDEIKIRWFSPVVPLVPEKIKSFCEIIYRISQEFGCEPMITFNYFSELYLDCTIPVYKEHHNKEYNWDAYFEALLTACHEEGFYPYRMDIDAQKNLILDNSVAYQLAKKIKQSLDPNNILAPGKYGI